MLYKEEDFKAALEMLNTVKTPLPKDSFAVLREAVERQIPKPALLERLRIQTKATCPNCKEAFAWVIKMEDLPAHCSKCGQKIADWWNWGKEEKENGTFK